MDKELDALDIVKELIHLGPDKMANSLAAINKALKVKPVKPEPDPSDGHIGKTIDHPIASTTKVSGLVPCSICGSSEFIRSGTCYTCVSCATTTGCS